MIFATLYLLVAAPAPAADTKAVLERYYVDLGQRGSAKTRAVLFFAGRPDHCGFL